MRTGIVAIAAALAFGSSGLCHAGAYSNDFSSSVGAASLRGDAVLDSGSVRLTPNSLSQEGSLVIDNLDPGRVVRGFDASFTLAMGPAGVTLAASNLPMSPSSECFVRALEALQHYCAPPSIEGIHSSSEAPRRGRQSQDGTWQSVPKEHEAVQRQFLFLPCPSELPPASKQLRGR